MATLSWIYLLIVLNVTMITLTLRQSSATLDARASYKYTSLEDFKSDFLQQPRIRLRTKQNIIRKIFFFSSFSNENKIEFVERLLETSLIPYERVERVSGKLSPNCSKNKLCRKNRGLISSYDLLMEQQHFPEMSLVFSNDIVDFKTLNDRLTSFPIENNDWDVIMINCNASSEIDEQVSRICYQSDALLWRDLHSLKKFRKAVKQTHNPEMIHCLFSSGILEAYCLNEVPTKHFNIDGIPLEELAPVEYVKVFKNPSQHLEPTHRPRESYFRHHIDRIYYINLEKNFLRRQLMKSWLRKVPIPFKRISAMPGSGLDECVAGKEAKCQGIAGLARTLLHIIKDEDTTGISMVVEDDYVLKDPTLKQVEEALQNIPPDWDVVRFDCWGTVHVKFDDENTKSRNNMLVIDMISKVRSRKDNQPVNFYGGTHMMLWRGGKSVDKLRKIWSRQPFDSVDLRLGGGDLKSYCVQIGAGSLYQISSEISDIQVEGN